MPISKILVIEDEPVHLDVIRSKLEKNGYNVVVAMDGESGFNALKKEKPDLVLLDIILPKMDGFGVLEKMKKNGNKTPVIIVSNSGQPVEINRAMKLGVKDFLVKAEFNPTDVLEKVAKVLGKPASGAESDPENDVPNLSDSNKTSKKENIMNITNSKEPKILVVEDDKFLRDLIVQKLKKEGFNPIEGADGEIGLKLAQTEKPSLVLLDLIIPILDGFEVLRKIKADDATKNIPVIVLSNLGQKEDIDRAISMGAEDFMVKAHFTPSEIIDKIRLILKNKYI